MTLPDTHELWRTWRDARELDQALTLDMFAERYGDEAGGVRGLLGALQELEAESPAGALVDVDPSQPFAGHDLLRVLGEGTTGIVYEARHSDHDDPVALKILNPLMTVDRATREALLREAEVVRGLDHPGILRVFDAGVDRGYAWLATELVDGEDLETLLAKPHSGEERREMALRLAVDIASALEHAHARGVIHRDVKPSNIRRRTDGSFVLLDFGLAHADDAAFAITRTGQAIGTPIYMAPEQLRGERRLGPTIDLYALGLVMLEVLRGKRLVAGSNALRALARIASGRWRVGRDLLRGLPPGFRDVIQRCLEPRADDRYADASMLLQDLDALRSGAPLPHGGHGRWHRLRREVQARPVLVTSLVTIILGLVVANEAWRRRPRLVQFETLEPGKVVHFDGTGRWYTTPANAELRPGRHSYRTLAGREDQAHAPIVGTFDVTADGAHVVVAALPTYPEETPEVGRVVFPTGRAADDPRDRWLELHTPHPQVVLELDGKLLNDGDPVPGVCAIAIGPGEGRLTVSAEGHRSRTLLFHAPVVKPGVLPPRVDLSAQLSREDEHWEYGLLYSLLDLREGDANCTVDVVHRSNLRIETLYERVSTHSRALGPARKVHGAAIHEDEAVELVLRIRFDEPLAAFEVHDWADPETVGFLRAEGSGVRVDAGPSLEDLSFVWGEGRVPEVWETEQRPSDRRENWRRYEGTTEVFVRERAIGPLAYVLRTNGLPFTPEGDRIVWDPAMQWRWIPQGRPLPQDPDVPTTTIQLSSNLDPGSVDTLPGALAIGDSVVAWSPADGPPGQVQWLDRTTLEPTDVPALECGRGADLQIAFLGTSPDGTELFAVGDLEASLSPLGLGRNGAVRLVDGRTGEVLASVHGYAPGDKMGRVAPAGDFDGDGVPDVIVGATQWENGAAGYARVLSGVDLGLLAERRARVCGDHFGMRLCPIGDTDGDGFDDVAVAAPDSQSRAYWGGEIHVMFGPDGTRSIVIEGDVPGDSLGRRIAPAVADDGAGLDGLWVLRAGGSEAWLHRGAGMEAQRVLRMPEEGTGGEVVCWGLSGWIWTSTSCMVAVDERGARPCPSGGGTLVREGDRLLIGLREEAGRIEMIRILR